MVRLSPSPVSLCSGGAKKRQGTPQNGPPAPQCAQATPDTPHPHETQDPFIADALTFLKHKIRNIEKKKIKLEDYRKRVKEGEKLNPDQMNAVERYREVGHNLSFAMDLQKTLNALSQDLLKAQRKVLRRAQVLRAEQEQQQLSTVLRIRHIMQKVQQEHVRKDLCTAQKHAHFLPDYQRSHAHFLSAHEESHTPFLSAQDLGHLLRLAPLLGLQRDDSMSFGAQMERASSTYQALLEGGDSPVAGSTYGYMKELLARLVQCGYFDHIPVPHSQSLRNAVSQETSTTEASGKLPAGPSQLTIPDEMPHREVLKRCCLLETDTHGKGWNGDCPGLPQDRKEELEQQKLQGCWEMEFMGRRTILQSDTQTLQEGAGFPCKEQRPAAEYKQATEAAAPAEGWSPLPCATAPDHALAPAPDHTLIPPPDHALAPSTEHTPIPPTDHALIPPPDHALAPAPDHTPIPPTDHALIPPPDPISNPPTDHTSIPPTDHALIPAPGPISNPPTDHTPIPPTDHALIPPPSPISNPPTDHTPIPATDHTPIPATDHARSWPQSPVMSPPQHLSPILSLNPTLTLHPDHTPILSPDSTPLLPHESAPTLPLNPTPMLPLDPAPTLLQTPGAQEDQLQLLLEQTQGTFTFLQDSVLDREDSPASGCSGMSAPAAGSTHATEPREPKTNQTAGIPAALAPSPTPPPLPPNEDKTSPTDRGGPVASPTDSTNDDDIHQSESGGFMSLPLQCRDSTPSISVAQNAGDQEEFKVDAPLMSGGDSDAGLEVGGVSCRVGVSTASTQTPPSARPPGQQALQPGIDLVWQHCHGNQSVASYQSECPIADGYQVYLCPGPPVGLYPFYDTAFYTRAAVQGRTRSGRVRGLSTHSPARHKGLLEGHRAGPWCFGGAQAPRSVRDAALVQFRARTGSQQSPGQGSGSSAGEPRNPCGASWSDSIQLGNPDRERPPCIASTGNGSGRGNSGYATPKTTPGPSPSPTLQVHRLAPPLRVAFSAARTANFTPGTLDQTITFDLLLSNLGEAFQPHLGRFTCPVSGTYVFIFHMLKLAVSAPLYVNLMRNEEVAVSAYANDGAPDHETASNHALLQLCLGDSVWLRLHRGAVYGSSWKYSTFSGYLLYQD